VQPTLTGRSIIWISSIDWGFLWQGHQEIASRFAADGNLVVFVENTGTRPISLRDVPRVVVRLRRSLGEVWGRKLEPSRGVRVVAPLLLPFTRSRIARWLNEKLMLPRLASQIRAIGISDPIIVACLPTPNALGLIRLLRTPKSRVIYYCVADFLALTDDAAEVAESERRLVLESDAVFVQGEPLVARFTSIGGRHLHAFHVGTNLEVFDPDREFAVSPEIAGLPRPIIGYSGGLHRFVDLRLVRDVARAYPGASVVLIGPVQADVRLLRSERNVHIFGARPFTELPAFVAGFDVGLVPYVRSRYTDTVYPTKLFEYLALGVPVVATDLPELVRLHLPIDALRLSTPGSRFVAGVGEALDSRSEHLRRLRRDLARSHSWGRIVRDMSSVIAELDAPGRSSNS
jgi:glycosyltransferase involved in cell wall biosynthesis